LLILSLEQGLAFGTQVQIPFLRDFAANVRFLIALPLLITSEIGIDHRLRILVTHFVKSGLVLGRELPRFDAAIRKVTRLRDRALPELAVLALAYIPSLSVQNQEILMTSLSTWHFEPPASGQTLSHPGWWFGLVSAPIFRFLLLRWLWRMSLWAWFLWQVSKLSLVLTPTHPDRAAGLGFLSGGQLKFGIIAFAVGTVAAAQMANALAYQGETLAGLRFTIIGYCAFAVIVLVTPLLLLIPTLHRVKKRGLLDYGALATDYTRMFDAKWVHGKTPEGQTILGSSDIQSLADLGNSFAFVREMRMVPIDKRTLLGLALAAVLPMGPVLLLAAPAEDLIRAVLKLLV
jgi:hypothetical protein